MVRLREISRTAAFAWSPGAGKPLIVTGTRAGAVDADFSGDTKLELWDLDLDNQEQGLELQPLASIAADSRFYDIAWGPPTEDYPQGVIAGALENGSLDLWDAEKLVDGEEDALIARTTKHTGAIKSLQFNPLRPQILATAGVKGELFIYDINDPRTHSDSALPPPTIWNVAHILATGGSGGFVTVWDLKTKKASLTLNNNRKPVSAIAWDPNNSTKLMTATYDDLAPVILLWNLRNSNAPERTLQGHEQGILSLSWCQQDDDLLLSCGKDNRTVIWSPHTGARYGEFPEVTNWTFSVRFHPHNPNLSATASFDGKITVQTFQNTNPSAVQNNTQNNLDGEDFFTQAQTQPQGAAFTLAKAPKWLERPVGVTFGFGGKLITFKPVPTQPGQPRASKIEIAQFSVDSDIGTATEKFEESLKAGDIGAICESHKDQATTDEEKAEWQVMSTLLSDNPRQRVIEYLGFSKGDEEANGVAEDSTEDKDEKSEKLEAEKGHKKNRLSTFFSDNAEGEGDDFLASLSATKGAKTDNPFHLFGENDSAVEKEITKALMLGQFEKATMICLDEKRMADAFMIANCGGKELMDKVQAAYISQKDGMPNYLRLLSSVIVKNLWDVVYNADLTDWKETMVTLCTFADPAEFPDLCEALETGFLRLEKVVGIWISEFEEAEKAGMAEGSDTTFSVHARTLQQFIEKVTVFRQVAKFQDTETALPSGWKLSALYDKYTEYADIVAAHGQLTVAQKYLELLPTTYPAADVARNRIRQATQKKTAQPAAAVPAGRTSRPTVPAYMPPAPAQSAVHQSLYGAPTIPTPQANLYAPPSIASNPYAPQQGYQPTPPPQQGGYAPPISGYAPPQGNFGAPQGNFGLPKTTTGPPPSSTRPPPLKEAGNWNDVPMVARPPPPRKPTPNTAAVNSPYAGQAGMPTPPPPQSPYTRGTATPPPPPKGPAYPRVMSPLGGGQQAGQMPPPPRPGSTTANQYAPPPMASAGGSAMPHPPPMANVVGRTASPYNAPPAAGPPSNRYAPAPGAQTNQPPQMAPPQAPSPYAPQQAYEPSMAQQGPPSSGPPSAMSGPPMSGPPMGGPPRTGPSAGNSPAPPPPRSAAASPAKPKHPLGDRSHIPASAQPLVDILSRDMQRVAAKAPASFAPQVKDTQKRINILFDHLNNEELVKPDTIQQLTQLATLLEGKNYPEAQQLQVSIQTDRTEECGNWMVGVKRLISMSKATP
ncbi:hypothetical protein PG994_001249 [Apiospora phragmitis]|uniref:Protein transport protein SEC31 n=1 Tax=Apiospora phragmitis TaxID=2905665 RepID=A0ABR1WSY7_9PEZI